MASLFFFFSLDKLIFYFIGPTLSCTIVSDASLLCTHVRSGKGILDFSYLS